MNSIYEKRGQKVWAGIGKVLVFLLLAYAAAYFRGNESSWSAAFAAVFSIAAWEIVRPLYMKGLGK